MPEFVIKLTDKISEDINGSIAVAVVDINSGMALGVHSNDSNFDPEVASAYNTEVVRSKLKAIEALNLNQRIDDILISLENQYHIINVNKSATHMIYVAADKRKANLAMARAIIKKYMTELEKKI